MWGTTRFQKVICGIAYENQFYPIARHPLSLNSLSVVVSHARHECRPDCGTWPHSECTLHTIMRATGHISDALIHCKLMTFITLNYVMHCPAPLQRLSFTFRVRFRRDIVSTVPDAVNFTWMNMVWRACCSCRDDTKQTSQSLPSGPVHSIVARDKQTKMNSLGTYAHHCLQSATPTHTAHTRIQSRHMWKSLRKYSNMKSAQY